MAYYRKSVIVGWVDEEGKLYPLTTAPVNILELDLTPCYAAVGEWYDDGMDCRRCNIHIGYGPSYKIDGKTLCGLCRSRTETITEYVPDKRLDGKQYRRGTPGRLDVNGVEWWACDPYPTWYRWEGDHLYTNPAAWAD